LDRNITAIGYRAPEVLLHSRQLDFPQSAFDMWSYGVVMCALLCGTHLFCIPFKARKDKEIKVLRKQIDLLGPPDWPDIKELPTWSEYAQHLQIEESGVSTDLRAKLASTKFVRRPLGSLEIELLGWLLRWCPSSRMTAVDAGSHTYWSAASQHTSEKTVGGCSLSSQASGTEAGVPPLFSQASIETLSLGESGVSVAPPEACYRTAESHVLGRTVCVQMLRCPGPAIAGLASARSTIATKESPQEKYIAQRMRKNKAN
jgi:serine/threonine protein kinase